jgi:CheY-like chemotaxis protein
MKEAPMMFQQPSQRILVIEHNTWIRADLVLHLVNAGYQVWDASNGFTGLRLARGPAPDLTVLGEALSEIAPAQLREELAGDPRTRSVPVIALDADGRNIACLVAGMVRQVLEARAV